MYTCDALHEACGIATCLLLMSSPGKKGVCACIVMRHKDERNEDGKAKQDYTRTDKIDMRMNLQTKLALL